MKRILKSIGVCCVVVAVGCEDAEPEPLNSGVTMSELPDSVYEQLTAFCAEGAVLAEDGRYTAAIEKYWAAWDLLPEPKEEWGASTTVLGAIGELSFVIGDFETGRKTLSFAMKCPDAIGDTYIHLRLGQCQFELGNLEEAADELARAYIPEGIEAFEDEDRKYLEFVKSKLDPPSGGWPEGW